MRAEIRRREAEREKERLRTDGEAIRARCHTLAGFIREAWAVLEPSTPYVHGWHVDAICHHLEAITTGRLLELGVSNRLLINVPPGTMKSLIVSVFWPAWEWGPCAMPALRYLTTSYSEKYVKRDSRRMRDLVQSEWYRTLWPEVELTRAGEASFANSRQGFREGVPFGSLTGGRGDRVIIDDPHSTETAESDAERETTIRIFRESVPSRVNDPTRSAIVIIMQRLHDRDVSGVALGLGLGYQHLMLPMEFEPDRACSTVIGFRDPRSYAGELLCPERFTPESIARDQRALTPYAIAGQYQQRPAPRDGGLFKSHWFEIVQAVPSGLRRVRRWDLAGTKPRKGADPDWTVGMLAAKAPDGTIYIEDVVRFRGDPSEVERAILATAKRDGVSTQIRLPQDPGQAGKMQARYFVTQLAGHSVTAEPETGSKATRAEPVAAQAAVGNIKLLSGPWNAAFIDEVCMFPSGSHDDQVDALSGAFTALMNAPSMLDVL